MKQINDLADFLDYVDQVVDIHGPGAVADRYGAVLAIFDEYREYRAAAGSSSDLESVTAATAGGSPVCTSGPFKIH